MEASVTALTLSQKGFGWDHGSGGAPWRIGEDIRIAFAIGGAHDRAAGERVALETDYASA